MNIQPTHATLKLSIWRKTAPARAFVLQNGEDSETRFVASDSDLHEEVYSWSLREYIFAGVEDEGLRRDLHEKIFDRMDPNRPPSERPLTLLDEFVDAAFDAMKSGAVKPVRDRKPPDGDDETFAEVKNTLLALALHLKWLSRCFADRPGISVSVR